MITEKIHNDMVAALKLGYKEEKETLTLLLAALKNAAVEKREALTEDEEVTALLKERKQTVETRDTAPAERSDIITAAENRLAIIDRYLPKMMDENEIESVVDTVLADLGINVPTAKDKGRIMKVLMPKVKGKADGKLVNSILAKRMR